ncbi:GATA transcription factor 15-like isoform X2 [Syzygium oleosum]|uniref:GATA transcription factor 15-like isoform X2 n=1 Tax=Syzygium oleosum TaxID=219896 RepID=UPI0024B8B143|nr:GATA transcription factor 15-like isoform X2 [Syzygium oleosum]
MVFGAEVEEPLSVVEDNNDLHDDHAVPQFSSLCNACRIKSRRKRRAVMNKIGVEITKAKRSNSINGGSLKRRVLTRGREVLMQRPSSYLSEVESHLK